MKKIQKKKKEKRRKRKRRRRTRKRKRKKRRRICMKLTSEIMICSKIMRVWAIKQNFSLISFRAAPIKHFNFNYLDQF